MLLKVLMNFVLWEKNHQGGLCDVGPKFIL